VKRRCELGQCPPGVGHGDENPLSGHGFLRDHGGGPALQSVIDEIMAVGGTSAMSSSLMTFTREITCSQRSAPPSVTTGTSTPSIR
jgi:hypothetical protein